MGRKSRIYSTVEELVTVCDPFQDVVENVWEILWILCIHR